MCIAEWTVMIWLLGNQFFVFSLSLINCTGDFKVTIATIVEFC